MKDFLEAWPEISTRVDRAGAVLLLTDFDGTLVPIEERPEGVTISDAARAALEEFKSHPKSQAGVVSGRKLADLEARVGVQGVWYVGNHGFELRTPAGKRRDFYSPADAGYVRAVEREIAGESAGIPGVLVENKGPTLAVHYRLVEPENRREIERICQAAFYRHSKRLRLMSGLCVFELRLREAITKGTAVRLIRKESPKYPLIFYFGDDVTDDDVFRMLQGVGIGVMVGSRESDLADYSLRGPGEVLEAMSLIHRRLSGTPIAG